MTPPEISQQPLTSIEYTHTKVVKSSPDLFRQRRVIMGLKNDPHIDIFRRLRTQVLRKLRENQWNSLAVTSATSGAGKSFVTVNLAIALAMEVNQTVLVVDADLRNPSLGWFFGFGRRTNEGFGNFRYSVFVGRFASHRQYGSGHTECCPMCPPLRISDDRYL